MEYAVLRIGDLVEVARDGYYRVVLRETPGFEGEQHRRRTKPDKLLRFGQIVQVENDYFKIDLDMFGQTELMSLPAEDRKRLGLPPRPQLEPQGDPDKKEAALTAANEWREKFDELKRLEESGEATELELRELRQRLYGGKDA